MKKIIVVWMLVLFGVLPLSALAKPLKVGLIAPRPERPYWGTVVRFT